MRNQIVIGTVVMLLFAVTTSAEKGWRQQWEILAIKGELGMLTTVDSEDEAMATLKKAIQAYEIVSVRHCDKPCSLFDDGDEKPARKGE